MTSARSAGISNSEWFIMLVTVTLRGLVSKAMGDGGTVSTFARKPPSLPITFQFGPMAAGSGTPLSCPYEFVGHHAGKPGVGTAGTIDTSVPPMDGQLTLTAGV